MAYDRDDGWRERFAVIEGQKAAEAKVKAAVDAYLHGLDEQAIDDLEMLARRSIGKAREHHIHPLLVEGIMRGIIAERLGL